MLLHGGALIDLSAVLRPFSFLRCVMLVLLVLHFMGTFSLSQLFRLVDSLSEKSQLRILLKRSVPNFYEDIERNFASRKGDQSQQKNLGSLKSSESVNENSGSRNPPEDRCESLAENEKSRLAAAAGANLVEFLESVSNELHSTSNPEQQLKLLAANFDHLNWSRALMSRAFAQLSDEPSNNMNSSRDQMKRIMTKNGDVSLQANLSHALLFLTHYNRILGMTRRQELSALSAFRWDLKDRHEISRKPASLLIQSYEIATCQADEAEVYGCSLGEKLFLLRALLSPRLACRFLLKRDHYVITYWIRVGGGVPKILEVESMRERLVQKTKDEQSRRRFASFLSPDLDLLLPRAGMPGVVPLRAVMIWRDFGGRSFGGKDFRKPASDKSLLRGSPGSKSGPGSGPLRERLKVQ